MASATFCGDRKNITAKFGQYSGFSGLLLLEEGGPLSANSPLLLKEGVSLELVSAAVTSFFTTWLELIKQNDSRPTSYRQKSTNAIWIFWYSWTDFAEQTEINVLLFLAPATLIPHTRTLSQLDRERACEGEREREKEEEEGGKMRAGSLFPPLSLSPSLSVSSPTLSMTGCSHYSHPHTDNGSAAHTFPCECVLYYRRSPHTPLHGSTLVGFFFLFSISNSNAEHSLEQSHICTEKAWVKLKHTHFFQHTLFWVGASCHEKGWGGGYTACRSGNFSRLVLYKQV